MEEEEEGGGVERVRKANGRWPFSGEGRGTMQHSAMEGWVEMACSMEPVWGGGVRFWGFFIGVGGGRRLTC